MPPGGYESFDQFFTRELVPGAAHTGRTPGRDRLALPTAAWKTWARSSSAARFRVKGFDYTVGRAARLRSRGPALRRRHVLHRVPVAARLSPCARAGRWTCAPRAPRRWHALPGQRHRAHPRCQAVCAQRACGQRAGVALRRRGHRDGRRDRCRSHHHELRAQHRHQLAHGCRAGRLRRSRPRASSAAASSGSFHLGSTAIVMMGPSHSYDFLVKPGATVRLGQAVATRGKSARMSQRLAPTSVASAGHRRGDPYQPRDARSSAGREQRAAAGDRR